MGDRLDFRVSIVVSVLFIFLVLCALWFYVITRRKLPLEVPYRDGTFEPLAVSPYPRMNGYHVFVIRLALCLWCTALWITAPVTWGSPTFSFYTIWNFTVVMLYFQSVTLFSYLHLFGGGVGTGPKARLWRTVQWVVMQNEFALAILINFTVWTILFPLADAKLKHKLLTFTNWTYHFSNALFFMLDMTISCCPVSPHWGIVTLTMPMLYTSFAWGYYEWRQRFRYPFMDPSYDLNVFFIFLLFLLHALFYAAVCWFGNRKSRLAMIQEAKARYMSAASSLDAKFDASRGSTRERVPTAVDPLELDVQDVTTPTHESVADDGKEIPEDDLT